MAVRYRALCHQPSVPRLNAGAQTVESNLSALLVCMLVLFSTLLGGCQSLTQARSLSAQADQMRVTELDDVPFHSDNTTLCGPSALASVLQFSGDGVSVEELTRDVYLPGRNGSLQIEMLNTVRRRNQVAYLLDGNTDSIQVALNHRYPVLVFMNLGLDFAPSWHYAVVVGTQVQAGGQRDFILRSGTQRRQVFSEDLFRRVWARGKHWAMIVSSPTDIPRFLSPQAVMNSILAMPTSETVHVRQTALEAAYAAFPGDAGLSFALASELQRNADYPRAESLWRTLASRDGHAAAAANLADLLNQQGRTTEAVQWACTAQANLHRQNLSDSIAQRIRTATERIITASNARCDR